MAEAATGARYEDLLRHDVYRPLGLRDTSLPQGYEMPDPYMHGYAVGGPSGPEDVSETIGMSGVWASGGITSSPRDLTAFISGYAAGALTSKAAVREQRHWIPGASEPAGLAATVPDSPSSATTPGAGWSSDIPGTPLVTHS